MKIVGQTFSANTKRHLEVKTKKKHWIRYNFNINKDIVSKELWKHAKKLKDPRTYPSTGGFVVGSIY